MSNWEWVSKKESLLWPLSQDCRPCALCGAGWSWCESTGSHRAERHHHCTDCKNTHEHLQISVAQTFILWTFYTVCVHQLLSKIKQPLMIWTVHCSLWRTMSWLYEYFHISICNMFTSASATMFDSQKVSWKYIGRVSQLSVSFMELSVQRCL